VEKGSVNFIFGGNGFFGYFFSNSADDAPNRDSPYHICDPGDSLAWWSTYEIEECPDHKNIDKADVTRQLQKRHREWKDPAIQKILGSLEVERMYPTWTSAPIPTWERDGVILVGDAAHALPPSSGQGSSQALEDVEALALILAHHLRNEVETSSGSYKTVFKAAAGQYMEIRQPHVSKILQAAQENQNKKREMGVIQEYMMYGFLKLVGM
jgi:2-polyprenyl-6-methoxyphenol hydroxylase-like FAD-dependent oxidoreductase